MNRLLLAAVLSVVSGCAAGAGEHERTFDPIQRDAGVDASDDDDDGAQHDDPERVCAYIHEEAADVRRLVDIIFVIDNSGSMGEEIFAVNKRINRDFAQIIEDSGVDYRVIMISYYSDGNSQKPSGVEPVCIEPPLGGTLCKRLAEPLQHGARFFHYNEMVQSYDGACRLLDTFARSDQPPRYPVLGQEWMSIAPNGWQEFLRKDAFKAIVFIGDEGLHCETESEPIQTFTDDDWRGSPDELGSAEYDARLRALSEPMFGTEAKRKYKVHTIVGIDGDHAFSATEPLVSDICATASSTALPYQEMAIRTGGLRYPVCRSENYDEVFHALAMDTIDTATVSCDWAIPVSDEVGEVDPQKVNITFRPGAGGETVIPQAPSAAACAEAPDGIAWYYDDPGNPKRIFSCPSLCEKFERDHKAEVMVSFGCETITIL